MPRESFQDTLAGWQRQQGQRHVIHIEPSQDVTLAFAESVARGLDDHPRWLTCTYLYDDRGSEIFEAITRQPEYYQTRTEDAILAAQAAEIRRSTGPSTLVELGSGSSTKTRHLLDAWTAQGPTRYVPIDVSQAAVQAASDDLLARYPDLTLEGFASTYERALPLAARFSPLTLIFLGSTVGNFNPSQLDSFLDMISGHLTQGDHLVLGVDRVKDVRRLEAAYNDAAGHTRAFVVNLFDRMNRELGSRVPLDAVDHVAYYNDQLERIEIYARFLREVHLELPLIGQSYRLAAGEMVLTEISRKFRPEAVATNLNRFGLSLQQVHTDPEELFAVLLFRRRQETPYTENRRQVLRSLLRRVRGRTLDLISPLVDLEDAGRLPESWSRAVAPHVAAVTRYESRWLVDALGDSQDAPPDAPAATSPEEGFAVATEDGVMDSIGGCLRALSETRRRTFARLADVPLDPTRPLTAGGQIYRLVAEHEARRQELILEAVQQQPENLLQPQDSGALPPRPGPPSDRMQIVPAGEFLLGDSPDKAGGDSELPEQRILLETYSIDSAPVTNGRYLEFVEDGGYRRREVWSEEGWAWLKRTGAGGPASWLRSEESWMVGHLGRWYVMDPARPVVHVSWYEASAFAAWAGKRLPTEQEWEKAASWDPERGSSRTFPWGEATPTSDHANLDQQLWQLTPVGSYPRGRSFYGCHQMLGDVWEWTASRFEPYAGFEPFPDRAHSVSDFGAGFRVLRGGSWATPSAAIRAATRRWKQPDNRTAFAGFRCAADA